MVFSKGNSNQSYLKKFWVTANEMQITREYNLARCENWITIDLYVPVIEIKGVLEVITVIPRCHIVTVVADTVCFF